MNYDFANSLRPQVVPAVADVIFPPGGNFPKAGIVFLQKMKERLKDFSFTTSKHKNIFIYLPPNYH